MGLIGQAIAQPLPTVSSTTGPAWATLLNAFLTEVKARLEAKVDSASTTLTTGDVIHATRTIQLGAAAGQGSGTTWTKGTGGSAGYHLATGATDTVEWAVQLERNQRVTAVRVTGRSTGTAWQVFVWLVDTAAGTRNNLNAGSSSGVLTSIEEIAAAGLAATTVGDGQHIVVEWRAMAASTRCLAMELDYDRQVGT